MNLTDLRDELRTQTLDITADDSAIANGVASKVAATKRRRAAGGIAGAAAAALVVGVVAVNTFGTSKPAELPAASSPSIIPSVQVGPDGMPYRSVPAATGDVTKDGVRYRATVADDKLAVGVIGDPGQSEVSKSWTPKTDRVSVASDCYVPKASDARLEQLMVMVSVDGHDLFGTACHANESAQADLPTMDATGGAPDFTFEEVKIGAASTLTVRLVDRDTKQPVPDATVRLAAAVYDLGPQVPVQDAAGIAAAMLPATRDYQGYTYRFWGMSSGPVTDRPLPTIDTPAGTPILVDWGSVGTGDPNSLPDSYLELTGLSDSSGNSFGGTSISPSPGTSTVSLGLRAQGKAPTKGRAYIAIYVLTD